MSDHVKVLFLCTGVGTFNRGIETFFREAFDGLKGNIAAKLTLAKGGGPPAEDERLLWNLRRTGRAARFIGTCVRRDSYVVEQLTAFPAAVKLIREIKPEVILYSDSNIGFQLFRWRQWIGVPYRLLFSNGGPCVPPFDRTHFVHQVAPFYLEAAMAAGEPRAKHHLVPYGIRVPDAPTRDAATIAAHRARLGLPLHRPVVLSVGWIAKQHKRMDYVIREVASLPQPRPYLQLLGSMDDGSREVIELGRSVLGPDGFAATSAPYDAVTSYYQAADIFVLGSLAEGFGRVFLEAMMHGLPVLAHRHPVMDYVTGGQGNLGDLTKEGALASLLRTELARPQSESSARARWHSVKERFSWQALAPAYQQMFLTCARAELP